MDQFEHLLVEKNQGIALVTLNRPKQLNALNKALLSELNIAFEALRDDAETKVVLLTGSGEKAFVAGADIKEFSSFNGEQGAELSKEGHLTVFNVIEEFPKPVIAAVNGFALGGGLELAMSAHIRIASDNARMGLPETSTKAFSIFIIELIWGHSWHYLLPSKHPHANAENASLDFCLNSSSSVTASDDT